MKILLKSAIAAVALAVSLGGASAQNIKRSITKVAGDVYRFQNNFHYSLVTVTSAGVVVVDPIHEDAAAWLKANLSQISDKPITHLIYSHSHGDHASGGTVFKNDGALVIAQENAPDAIDGVVPDIRFSEEMDIRVGGKTFELTWLGEGHGQDLIAVVVRPENVAFITDAAAPKRLPYRDFPRSDIDGWISQIEVIESLDFDIMAPAHGNVGTKLDATDARVYMLQLRDQVLRGLRAGKTTDELAASVTMDAYKDWGSYANWRELNVRGMAKYLMETDQVN
jgi:glyoxylase-like metal-dependent hydrolase (beta-lactamase superfamily II)